MQREPASLILSHARLNSTLIFICICINDTDHCASAENEEKKRLWPTFFGRDSAIPESCLIPACEDWGFCHIVYISRLHTLRTQRELQSLPLQIGRWKGWCLTYPQMALPMPNPQEWDWHDLRSFCAFLRSALAESPLNFLPLSLPSFHESPHPHPQHPNKPLWKPKFASLNISNFLSSHLQKKWIWK